MIFYTLQQMTMTMQLRMHTRAVVRLIECFFLYLEYFAFCCKSFQFKLKTRKSSYANARGILSSTQQELTLLLYEAVPHPFLPKGGTIYWPDQSTPPTSRMSVPPVDWIGVPPLSARWGYPNLHHLDGGTCSPFVSWMSIGWMGLPPHLP